jgi:iron complex outermembrane receptor protein
VKFVFPYRVASVLVIGSASTLSAAQDEAPMHEDERIDEIIITAPFAESQAETMLPINVISGEELREKVTNSLGDTLKNEIGVNSASFGSGVGQPIIRGQTGNRVSVLQNGIALTDASRVSPDHGNGVEPLLADRLEIVRGPSTLLYGSGAIGGVVNVIDNRIPETLPGQTDFQLEQNYNSVNNENKTVFRLDSSIGNVGIHLDYFNRDNDNVEIDGFAIDEIGVERLEELTAAFIGDDHDDDHHDDDHHDDDHHDDDHDDDNHDEEEFENTNGFIGNSNGEAKGGTAGFSFVGDQGFFGFSYNTIENDYGLPPGTHSHAHGHGDEHEDEDHDDDHDDDHDGDHDDDHGDEHGEEEVEFVRLALDQQRYDFKGEYRFQNSWIESIRGTVGITDYEHSEIEFFEDGGAEVGTLYSNEGVESRFVLTRRPTGDWSGVYGLQIGDSEFSATGEEAFIAPSDILNVGLFGVERYSADRFTGELGFRFESADVDPGGRCAYDDNVISVSASGLYDVNESSNLMISAARSERAPSVEELFSNTSLDTCGRFADDEQLVLHAATGLLEIGNPNLDNEKSNNIEFGYRLNSGSITGEFSAYYNSIDDYIYLDITGEEAEEMPIAAYLQQDATFSGFEAELTFTLAQNDRYNAELTLFGDRVRADLDAGGNVPRIPASKFGSEIRYYGDNWSTHLHVTRVDDQEDAARLELATDGYTLVSIYADYHIAVGDSEVKLFARGDNLLDEQVRNHASFLKLFSPEFGRGVTLGVRYEY